MPTGPIPTLEEFAATYLQAERTHPDKTKELVALEPETELHRWLIRELAEMREQRGRRAAVIAPRGSAKSTWVSEANPIYSAAHGLEPYTLLLSDSGDQAKAHLSAIRYFFETNEKFRADYPQVAGQGPVWRHDLIELKNGCVIASYGTGARIRGLKHREARPSLVIMDDVEDDKTSEAAGGPSRYQTVVRRDKIWKWINRTVLNIGGPATNYLALGTTIGPDCAILRLQKTAGWKSQLFQAIEVWPQRMDLWAVWEGILNDWADPDREAKAEAYYLSHEGEMNQ